jgi:peptidoglycan/LPS O-acetylase OafA/YrhL
MSGSILSIAFDKMLLVELGMYFMAGMMLSKNFHLFSSLNIKWGVFLMCIALFIVFAKQPALSWLQFIIVPLATIMFAYLPIPIIHKTGRFGDFSYGIYIYGFLVQQLLVCLSNNTIGLYNMMWMAWFITVVLAVLSWHNIEKRALKHKNLFT